MKNLLTTLITILIFISLFISCEENFSPKTTVTDKTFMYAIVKADDSPYAEKQIVVINKIYDVDGFDPNDNTIDPTVKDAIVSLKYGFNTIDFSLDSVKTNLSAYTKQYIYSAYAKINSYDSLIISAKLSNGRTLSSRTRTPKYLNFTFSYPFIHGLTTNLNQVIPVYSYTISWTSNNFQHLLFPKFQIQYYQTINGSDVFKTIDIPNKYIVRNGVKEPNTTTYTREESISFDFEAIDSTMNKISAGNSQKSDYKLVGLFFQLVEFDMPLTNYYSSTNGYLDAYSVRSDESIYSNISGGYGIFGSMFTNSFFKELDANYVRSFGYEPY